MHRAGRREKRERRRHDFITSPDIQGPEREEQRIGAAGASDRIRGVTELRDRFLELLDGRAENEQLVIDDAHHGTDHFILDQ
jgi:hypothetical protein